METTKTEIQLHAPNDLANKVLNILGHKVVRCVEVYDDDDEEVSYSFPHSGKASVGVVGDNSIGACVGLYNDAEGELVGIFCFGDDGTYEYVIRDKDHPDLADFVTIENL